MNDIMDDIMNGNVTHTIFLDLHVLSCTFIKHYLLETPNGALPLRY